MSEDKVIHGLAWDDRVRVIAASMTNSVQEAVRIHQTDATASAALGRSLIGARLLQASVKDTERITLQIKGSGPVGLIVARALPTGEVYGSIHNPKVHLPPREDGHLNVGAAVGTSGEIIVVRDTGKYAEPYTGVTEILSGEIGDDLANYLLVSEQIPSAVLVGVMMGPDGHVFGAGGILVQLLGGLKDEEVEALEHRIMALQNVSERLREGADAQDLMALIGGDDVRILEEKNARYHCDRDRTYYAEALGRMNAATIDEIFGADAEVQLTCEFTQQVYTFQRNAFPASEESS